jgi:hypothetical protein
VVLFCCGALGRDDSQIGARICNGLGIMRACLETQKLEQLESRMLPLGAPGLWPRKEGACRDTASDAMLGGA